MKCVRVPFFTFALALVLLSPFNEAAAEEKLGRLFYTPAQRATMGHAVTGDHANTSSVTRFDGQIRRSDGKTVNWINGTFEGSADGAQSLLQRRLKIGQAIETQTGEVHDRLGGGRIVVRDAP